jgi:hypothetical protein
MSAESSEVILEPSGGILRALRRLLCPKCKGSNISQRPDGLVCGSCNYRIPLPGVVVTIAGERTGDVHKYASWLINRYRFGVVFVVGTVLGWIASMLSVGDLLMRL